MEQVVNELRRILKPTGSALFVIGPNYSKAGKMNTWHLEFVLHCSKVWNVVQDAYWVKPSSFPGGASTQLDLMRSAVEWCVWVGNPDCYRNQSAVLRKYSDSYMNKIHNSQRIQDSAGLSRQHFAYKGKQLGKGSTPFNYTIHPTASYDGHPACYPASLASWWMDYICPPGGSIIDPFSGSGTTGEVALLTDRSYVGIEANKEYARKSRVRLRDVAQRQSIEQRTLGK